MLILRDVHYVIQKTICRRAWVVDHGVDSADLHVYFERDDPAPQDPMFFGRVLFATNVRYDERQGDVGTWHTESDCPWRK